MATRVQGLWRQYARADQLAKDWDELMLRVGHKNHGLKFWRIGARCC